MVLLTMFKRFSPGQNSPRLSWQGFPFQLFLFTILPLSILLIIIAFGSMAIHQQAMRSLVGDRNLRAVRSAANSLSQEINHQVAALQFVEENAGNENEIIQMIDQSRKSLSGFDQGVALFSPQGEMIYANQPARDWHKRSPDFKTKVADLLARSAQGPAFSQAIELDTGNPMMLTSLQLINGNLLIGAFNPSRLIDDGLNGALSGGQLTAVVVDRDYQPIYQVGNLASGQELKTHPGIGEALNGESGINYFQTPEGEHVVAFSPVYPVGWALMIEEPWETVASPVLRTTQEAPFVLVPLLLLALLAIWFGVRRIAQPLQALESKASELANGNFKAIQEPVGGIPEIRHLQTELISMAHKVDAAQESLHDYIGAITAGIESERRNLARELHDDTIQALIALNQRIQLVARSTTSSNGKAALQELQQVVQGAMVSLRRIIRGLRPIYLEDLGLVAALGMLSQEVSQATNLPVDFRTSGNERRLEPAEELALYRIAQEALSNVVRHANARNAWIEIDYQPTHLRLAIRDDGIGFDVPNRPGNLAQKGHFGLVGLRERAELIDGELKIDSSHGKGTMVSVRLEYPGQAMKAEEEVGHTEEAHEG